MSDEHYSERCFSTHLTDYGINGNHIIETFVLKVRRVNDKSNDDLPYHKRFASDEEMT